MEAVLFCKTSVDLYQTTRRYIPEDSTLHSLRYKILISSKKIRIPELLKLIALKAKVMRLLQYLISMYYIEDGVVSFTPLALYPGKQSPIRFELEAVWAHGPICTLCSAKNV
jgi:hypothetical protein